MASTLRRITLQQVSRNVRKSSDYAPTNFKHPTMDNLPVPCGSWQADYNAKQSKYNRHLIIGTGFFIISAIVGKGSGYFNMYMTPPPLPKD